MAQTSAAVIAGRDAKASEFNKVVADIAEIYAGGPGVPVGGVIFFWSDNTVPLNYKICDGTVLSDAASPLNGLTLPNLIDRFVRGIANANVRSTPNAGGTDSVVLSWGQMPVHNHGGSTDAQGNHQHNIETNFKAAFTPGAPDRPYMYGSGGVGPTGFGTQFNGNHAHNLNIGTAGNNEAHTNIPAYTGLVPIIRVK